MQKSLKRLTENRFFWPLVTFVLIIVIEHLVMREYVGDAVNEFSHYLDHQSLLAVLKYRYLTWSSRTLIEATLLLFARGFHWYIWMVVDIVMMIVIWVSLATLTRIRNPWVLTAFLLIYPMAEMSSAGWMATTINYLWPLAMMLVALIPLSRMYHGERVNLIFAIVALLAELFATNFETVSIMYLLLLAYFSIVMLGLRSISVSGAIYTIAQWGVVAGNLIWMLKSPGNWARNAAEAANWMKDFGTLSFFDKFVLGVNTTTLQMLSSNLLFVIFAVLLVYVTFLNQKGHFTLKLGLAAVPLTCMLAIRAAPVFFPEMTTAISAFSQRGRVNSINYFLPASFLVFIMAMVVLTSAIVIVFDVAPNLIDGGLVAIFLGSGLLTRIAMGFSPTLYASDSRTFLFLDFAMIYCMIQMMSWITQASPNQNVVKVGKFGLYGVAMIAVTGNLLAIGTGVLAKF